MSCPAHSWAASVDLNVYFDYASQRRPDYHAEFCRYVKYFLNVTDSVYQLRRCVIVEISCNFANGFLLLF